MENKTLDYFIKKGVKIVNENPKGWEILSNATTSPVGYVWMYNGKSLFSGERKRKLLKIND